MLTLSRLKARLGISHSNRDDQLAELYAGALEAAQTFCGRRFESERTVERYNGNGKTALVLRRYPVLEIHRVRINGREIADTASDDWLLLRGGGFPAGIRNIEVDYTAGFDELPPDLADALAAMVMQRLNEIDNKGVQSKSLAGETVSFAHFGASSGLPPAVFDTLKRYRSKC